MKRNKLIIIGIGIAIITFSLCFTIVFLLNQWFETHRLLFHSPIEIALFQPVRVEVRKPEVIVEKFVLDYPGAIDTPIKKYIADKWGIWDAKTALAIAKAESRFEEQIIGINSNSIDVGIFQINSVHFNKPGCSLKDVVDQYKNVDCAYSIYLQQGWSPWVVFQTGAFKKNL